MDLNISLLYLGGEIIILILLQKSAYYTSFSPTARSEEEGMCLPSTLLIIKLLLQIKFSTPKQPQNLPLDDLQTTIYVLLQYCMLAAAFNFEGINLSDLRVASQGEVLTLYIFFLFEDLLFRIYLKIKRDKNFTRLSFFIYIFCSI